jgi:hypothetical protein
VVLGSRAESKADDTGVPGENESTQEGGDHDQKVKREAVGQTGSPAITVTADGTGQRRRAFAGANEMNESKEERSNYF